MFNDIWKMPRLLLVVVMTLRNTTAMYLLKNVL